MHFTRYPTHTAPVSDQRRGSVPAFIGRIAVAVSMATMLVLAAGTVSAQDVKIGDIQIEHPWSRATPPGASVAAGYVVIENTGTTSDRLVSASAEIAGETQIHEMSMANGTMTMRPLKDGIVLKPKETVELKPSAYHLMFTGLKKPLRKGEQFDATLTFEKAGTVNVKFAIEAIGATGPAHDDHMHMK